MEDGLEQDIVLWKIDFPENGELMYVKELAKEVSGGRRLKGYRSSKASVCRE